MIQNKWALTVIFAIYFTFIGLWGNGCSSGKNPLTPQDPVNQAVNNINLHQSLPDSIPVAFTGDLPDGGRTGYGVLGVFDARIDPVNLTGELISRRKASAIKDSFVVDITNFLTITPCTDCLKITKIELNEENNLVVRFDIRHPFEHGTFAEPPSARNRLDLHLFDVFGVLHFPGTLISFPLFNKTVAPVSLVNADGYTGQFDSQIDPGFPTDANIHPYRVMSLNPTEGNFNPSSLCGFDPINAPTGHNVLKMGGQASTDFEIANTGSDPVDFAMVITAAYGQSATKNTRLDPKYYMPEFNRKEAWKVTVSVDQNTLFEGNHSSYCNLGINVWDWNHDAAIDPDMKTMNTIRTSSVVASVNVEIPGVSLDTVKATGPLSGNGRTTPLHYSAHVLNTAGASYGTRYGIVKVLDSRPLGLNAGGVGDAINGKDGTPFQLAEFAAYQIFTVEVHRPEPIAVIVPAPDPPVIYSCQPIIFDGSDSYDFDGQVVKYEWDFEYYAPTFNVDALGTTPPARFYFNHDSYNNREVTVALRVTDNDLYVSIGTCVVTVLPNQAPVADFVCSVDPPIALRGENINFDASSSFDPDCDDLTYEWDWDYKNGVFATDDIGATPNHVFNSLGCYTVALRVTDEGSPGPKYDIATKLFTITPRHETSQMLNNTMTARDASHSLFSSAIASDPNTDDVYVAYYGLYSSAERIRLQRSHDGGITWGPPIIFNTATNNSGKRGIALCVVPEGTPPGTVYCFWIGDGGNSSGQTSDGWNIRFNKGTPKNDGTNDFQWVDAAWHQDITLYYLSLGAPNQYHNNYYTYSQPTCLSVACDPNSGGRVYLAYSETSTNTTYGCGKSVRLLKTSNISAYPSAPWQPVTTTSHVDSTTSTTNDYTGVDIAVDSAHNVFVVWDDNFNSQIEIRKYIYGSAPGNPAQVVDTNTTYQYLSNPRIDITSDNNPVVVFNNSNFPGGVLGVPQVVLCYGTGSMPQMSPTIRINDSTDMTIAHQDPDVAIDKNCNMIYVTYEDRRDNSTKGEIYMTVLDQYFNVIRTDQIVNTSDPTHALADFDAHTIMTKAGKGKKMVTTWEEETDDTWAARAF